MNAPALPTRDARGRLIPGALQPVIEQAMLNLALEGGQVFAITDGKLSDFTPGVLERAASINSRYDSLGLCESPSTGVHTMQESRPGVITLGPGVTMRTTTAEHDHRFIDYGQGPVCETCRYKPAPMTVLNPSAIGNPDETPVVFLGD